MRGFQIALNLIELTKLSILAAVPLAITKCEAINVTILDGTSESVKLGSLAKLVIIAVEEAKVLMAMFKTFHHFSLSMIFCRGPESLTLPPYGLKSSSRESLLLSTCGWGWRRWCKQVKCSTFVTFCLVLIIVGEVIGNSRKSTLQKLSIDETNVSRYDIYEHGKLERIILVHNNLYLRSDSQRPVITVSFTTFTFQYANTSQTVHDTFSQSVS
ncbi:hypothetical protein BC943DRAFT_333720 [Umbelopsis sp. AD052]|nr:hypothetical protein BC943DRAFT_333720 [Umbelopsis sp. AD052]